MVSSSDLEAQAQAWAIQPRNGVKKGNIQFIEPRKTSIPSKSTTGTTLDASTAEARPKFKRKTEFPLMDLMSILRNLVESGDEKGVRNMMSRLHDMNIGKAAWPTIQDVSGNGLLQISALKGDVGMIGVLLANDFDINGVDSNHGTALQAAIYMDRSDVIDLLLKDRRILIDTQGGYYGCALQVAAYKASDTILTRLLKLGADRNVCGGKYGSVLQAAARTGLPKIVNLILGDKEGEVDVNYNGGAYGTALQAAAKGSYTRATKYLRHLSRGRVLRQPTDVPRAASEASPEEYFSVAKRLIDLQAEVNTSGKTLQSPVNAAAASGRYEMLKLLIDNDKSGLAEHKDRYSQALISAITQKFVPASRPKMVELLISKDADANFRKGSGLYNKPLTAAAAVGDEEVVKYLLALPDEKKARIDSESGIYGTALRAALSAKSSQTAKILIEKHADLRSGDASFGNVLHLAVFSQMDEIVTLLLDQGVDVNILDDCGQTALHVAAYRGYNTIAAILLKRGAKTDLEDAWGQTPLEIVDSVMERGSHPGPRLEYLQDIKRQLMVSFLKTNQSPTSFFAGPPISKTAAPEQSEQVAAEQIIKKFGNAKPVFSSPIWSPGLSFQATIVDFLAKGSNEYLHSKTLSIDDLLYRKEAIEETMAPSGDFAGLKPNLRWIHLPANNMTWVEVLLKILWAQMPAHPGTACKSFWGTDPYYVSPDLAPHARFVTPQCERLIPEIVENHAPKKNKNTLFLAMPYIHWEAYRAQEAVSEILDKIKEESLESGIIRSTKTWRTNPGAEFHLRAKKTPSLKRAATDDSMKDTNARLQDDDNMLLKLYLFKRWPIHLRRTLDQYYYSYLADTRMRDGDQVVTKARNQDLQRTLAATRLFPAFQEKSQGSNKPEEKSHSKKKSHGTKDASKKEKLDAVDEEMEPEKDEDSPVVMIDQLWLWILDEHTIVTSFPRRRMDKDDGDLDTEDKTDLLKTMLEYLRSGRRQPIQTSYDLLELIISQSVGILHRTDVIPDLDFLKIFGSRANWAVDTVMKRLTEFVKDFRKFMKWLNARHRDSDEYIRRFEAIFSVTDEALLLREIQDIKDELNMLEAVFNDQKMVLEFASKAVNDDRPQLGPASKLALELQSSKHGRHINRMHVQASQAYDNLKDLLDLKQQQANVLEARVSRNQAIASKEQGKTIMVFTIVTIIFLPLTFMTTIFTLPLLNFPRKDPSTGKSDPGGQLEGSYVFGIVVGVTIVLAIPLIIAAFKVKNLEYFWRKFKMWRNEHFPLHFQSSDAEEKDEDDPNFSEGEEKQKPVWKLGRLYWGGPEPGGRNKGMSDDID